MRRTDRALELSSIVSLVSGLSLLAVSIACIVIIVVS